MIEIVVHLKAVNRGLPEKNTAGSSEDIYESGIVNGEKGIQNMKDRRFIADPRNRCFYTVHLIFR